MLYVTNVVTLERWFNIYNIDHWIGWRKLSLAVTPEVHNFPLADGYTDLGCKYFRTQENVVSFAGEVMRTSGFRADETFAVLPEGFRPGSYDRRASAALSKLHADYNYHQI